MTPVRKETVRVPRRLIEDAALTLVQEAAWRRVLGLDPGRSSAIAKALFGLLEGRAVRIERPAA